MRSHPESLSDVVKVRKRLRRERELAFCGGIDFIPTEEYSSADAERAYEKVASIVDLAEQVVDRLSP